MEQERSEYRKIKVGCIDESKMRYCKGALLFMINNGKLPRDKGLAKLRNEAKNEGRDNILDVPGFLYHHDPKNKLEIIKNKIDG